MRLSRFPVGLGRLAAASLRSFSKEIEGLMVSVRVVVVRVVRRRLEVLRLNLGIGRPEEKAEDGCYVQECDR